MSRLSNYIFNARNKQKAKKAGNNHYSLNYKDAKKVGILFHIINEEYAESLNYFVKTLKQEGKRVKLLTFFDRVGSIPYDFQFDFFGKKEITTLGTIKSAKVDSFIEEEFDFLYCINIEHFPPFDSIMLESKAKCRIGTFFKGKVEDCFELMISLGENDKEDKLIEQMWHYSRELKKN